jgi:hypothetical protein
MNSYGTHKVLSLVLKLGHDRFLPYSFHCFIHYLPVTGRYIELLNIVFILAKK